MTTSMLAPACISGRPMTRMMRSGEADENGEAVLDERPPRGVGQIIMIVDMGGRIGLHHELPDLIALQTQLHERPRY